MAAKSSTALWQETTAITRDVAKEGHVAHIVSGWVCHHCNLTVWNKDASRLAFHLAGNVGLRDANNGFTGIEVCPQVPSDVANRAKLEMVAKLAKRANKSSLSAAGQVRASEEGNLLHAQLMQDASPQINDAKRRKADSTLSNLLGGQGSNLKLAYENMLQAAIKDIVAAGPGYKLPSGCTVLSSNNAGSTQVQSTLGKGLLAPSNISDGSSFKRRRQELLNLWKECLSDVTEAKERSKSVTLPQGHVEDGASRTTMQDLLRDTIVDAQSLLAEMHAALNEAAQDLGGLKHSGRSRESTETPSTSQPLSSPSSSSSPSSTTLPSFTIFSSSSSYVNFSTSSTSLPLQTAARTRDDFMPLLQAIEVAAKPDEGQSTATEVRRKAWL